MFQLLVTKMIGTDDRGATAAEYAILVSLIAAIIAGVVGILGLRVLELFSRVSW